jgi:hypothetical protein
MGLETGDILRWTKQKEAFVARLIINESWPMETDLRTAGGLKPVLLS